MDEIMINFFVVICECIKISLLFICLFKGRYKKRCAPYIIGIVVAGAVCGIESICSVVQEMIVWKSVLEIGISFLVAQGMRKEKLYKILISYCIINTVDNIMAVFLSYFFGKTVLGVQDTIRQTFVLELFTTCIYFGLLLLKKKNQELEKMKISVPDILMILFSLICIFFVVAGTQLLLDGYTSPQVKKSIAIGMMYVCIGFITLTILDNMLYHSKEHYRKELQEQDKYARMQCQLYEAKQESYEQMKNFKHDINKHMRYIYELSRQIATDKIQETDRAIVQLQDYIGQLEKVIEKEADYIDCGNSILSAVVSENYHQAQKRNIAFHCKGHLPREMRMNQMDICTIMGNILENAIEASMQTEHPYVDITLAVTKNEKYLITVRNSMKKGYVKKNKVLHTTKIKGSHGIGMKNVTQTVEKNGGMICWEGREHEFVVDILLE